MDDIKNSLTTAFWIKLIVWGVMLGTLYGFVRSDINQAKEERGVFSTTLKEVTLRSLQNATDIATFRIDVKYIKQDLKEIKEMIKDLK